MTSADAYEPGIGGPMRNAILALLTARCLIGYTLQAQVVSDSGPTKEEMWEAVDPCIRDGGGVMFCQAIEMREDNDKIDADLNAAYNKLRSQLHGTPFEQSLVSSEGRWIRERDKHCRKVSESGFDNDRDRDAAHEAIGIAFLECIRKQLVSRLEFINTASRRLDEEGIEHFHFPT